MLDISIVPSHTVTQRHNQPMFYPPTCIISSPLLRHSTRPHKAPFYLYNYHCNVVKFPYFLSPLILPDHITRYPLSASLNYDQLSLPHKFFAVATFVNDEPQTFQQIVRHSYWRQAIKVETGALQDTNTWTSASLPPGKHPIGCKWL